MHGSRSQRNCSLLAGGFMEEYSKECWGDGGWGQCKVAKLQRFDIMVALIK